MDESQASFVGASAPLDINRHNSARIDLYASDFEACPTPAPVWCRAYHAGQDVAVWFRFGCGRWNCPYCGRQKARMLVWRGAYGADELNAQGRPLEFVTVTSHEKLNAARSLAVLPIAWNKLNRRMKRAYTDPQYFAVPEQHADGRWHLHAIIAARLSKTWFKDNARACGLGYMSDVQELKAAGSVARYIAKYQGKLLEATTLPPRFRRVRASHGWPRLPPLPQVEGWRFDSEFGDAGEKAYYVDMGAAARRTVVTDHVRAWVYVESI